MVKLDKKLLLAGSTAMIGGYAGVFLVAPVLGYKLFFRGGLLPGVPENKETGLQVSALNWALAAAMHVPAMLNKTQPKELCLQQLVVMPVIAAASFLASRQD